MTRADVADLKRRLSDPREVARLLGLHVVSRQARGVLCRCPVGGGDDPSLSLTMGRDGTLQAVCFGGCISGSIFDLLAAAEHLDARRDFPRVLERATELAGGAAVTPLRAPLPDEVAPRCPPELYALLAERILDAGRLDRRRCVRVVEAYLEGRGLLGLARRHDWAALPGLGWLLDIARTIARRDMKPHDLLVAARLARWDRDGRLRPLFSAHRLVIPWRAPDGTVHALQRRSIAEGAGQRYVAPRGLEWPYGVERLRAGARVAIVEGAVDTEALGALYPRLDVVGIPGLRGWRASWARLFEGREVRVALDRGKPGVRGVVPEDVAAARIALDLRGRHEELPERAERCVICGGPEPWLCAGCGRRRAPEGGDWGEMWRARVTSRRG